MKEIGTNVQTKDFYQQIIIGEVPKDLVVSFNDIYENGTKIQDPSNLFEKHSFYSAYLSDKSRLYLLPKRTPYVAEPALDNMGIILSKDNNVTSMEHLSPHELMSSFLTFFKTQQAYEKITPISKHVISTNFHLNPLFDQSLFDRKANAQSIPDLHFHIFSFSYDELSKVQSVPTIDLNKNLKKYLRDPMFEFLRELVPEGTVVSRLLKDTTSFQSMQSDKNEGFKFNYERSAMTSINFYRDLQKLHTNYLELYREFAFLFADITNLDEKQMPTLLKPHVRRRNILQFIDVNSINSEEVKRKLLFLAGHLKSGKNVTPEDKLLLRGPAYTMYMTFETQVNQCSLYIAPRIFSTGNALSALGYFHPKNLKVDEEWIKERDRRQSMISELMSVS